MWDVNNLKQRDKALLLSTSSKALKMAINYSDPFISNDRLHVITKRATPEMFCNYKLSLLLYKTYNASIPNEEWIRLNFDQILGTRQVKFCINLTNKLRVGMNALGNRFHHLNNTIALDWLNKSYLAYKIECKKIFLTH